MSATQNIGNKEYLKKRIPQNPRYQHVKSRLDTGCSLTKQMERLEEIKKNYRYRKDELFKRLKVTTFAQLVLQVASITDLNETVFGTETQDDTCGQPETDAIHLAETSSRILQPSPTQLSNNDESGDSVFTPRSTLQSPNVQEKPYPDCPYLLLDVRERDLYDQCHITSAFSFPIATLSRTMNPFTKEVLNYKNAIGKIIIVYDEDERVASQAATTMCERGFENLFMLSGGLKVVTQKFPNGMTTGSSPQDIGQRRSALSLYQGSPETGKKWRFTAEDLDKIQNNFTECFMPGNPNSRLSRMSSGSAQSKSSRVESQQSLSVTDRVKVQSARPWK
ncbi:centrosomal protein of 41 kDa isoform X2 [Clupea harengus]|uniref:Centrosomal protein of 41 kDa isoform X2 n=1 Tax=Clupea harengus TaxID=7950 RepID=A0A8M1KLY2_CLUHA|nr:centrosomal protein of 41 kDa isoform X2 [Clupea harengus]